MAEDELKKKLQSLVTEVLSQAAGPLVDKMVDTVRDAARRRAREAQAEKIRRAREEFTQAQPPPGAAKPPPTPYTTLRVAPGAPLEVCEAAYRAMSRMHHPDGTQDVREKAKREERQKRLNLAIDAIRRERGAKGDAT